jgi:hypothetical protein
MMMEQEAGSSDLHRSSLDLGCNSLDQGDTSTPRRSTTTHAPTDADARGGHCNRHYYVDVQNPEESTYEPTEQHTAIDPAFRTQLQTGSEGDISDFLALPELIPAKKRKRQQPLLDYTHSRILTSREYITGMEQVLAQKEATAATAKRKKEEKEANKEQRKIEKEHLQKQKEDRAQARAAVKIAKDLERQEKLAAAEATGRRRRGGAATAHPAPAGAAAGGRGLNAGVPAASAGRGDLHVTAGPAAHASPDLQSGRGRSSSGDLQLGHRFEGELPRFTSPMLQGSPNVDWGWRQQEIMLQHMNSEGFYRPRPAMHPLFQPSPRYNTDLERERMVERSGQWEGGR